MLNADQLSDAAASWLEYASPEADAWRVPMRRVGDGPYYVLVAHDGAQTPYDVRRALESFAGVAVPYLCPTTRNVLTGRVSVHVVPALVYADLLDRQWYGQVGVIDRALEPAPFEDPPTEADLAKVLIGALTGPVTPGRRRDRLELAVAHACDALGWRTVAALVSGMDEDTRHDLADVVAVLAALTTEPAAAS